MKTKAGTFPPEKFVIQISISNKCPCTVTQFQVVLFPTLSPKEYKNNN